MKILPSMVIMIGDGPWWLIGSILVTRGVSASGVGETVLDGVGVGVAVGRGMSVGVVVGVAVGV